MKALSIRLDDRLGREFDRVCQKTGYKKNTLLIRLIDSFVRHQKERLSLKRGRRDPDPFEAVIGLIREGPLLASEDAIDEVVYRL